MGLHKQSLFLCRPSGCGTHFSIFCKEKYSCMVQCHVSPIMRRSILDAQIILHGIAQNRETFALQLVVTYYELHTTLHYKSLCAFPDVCTELCMHSRAALSQRAVTLFGTHLNLPFPVALLVSISCIFCHCRLT